MDRFKTYILPVLLVAAYPVLALYAYNIEAVDAINLLRPLVITLAAALLLLLLFRLILRSWGKASLLTATTLILFFSYGRLYAAAEQLNQSAVSIGHHRIIAPLFLVIWILLFWLIARQKGDLRVANQTVSRHRRHRPHLPALQHGAVPGQPQPYRLRRRRGTVRQPGFRRRQAGYLLHHPGRLLARRHAAGLLRL